MANPDGTDLTTRQLAEAIARAVMQSVRECEAFISDDATQAVLDTLDAHGCWFCKKTETPQGTRFEQLEL